MSPLNPSSLILTTTIYKNSALTSPNKIIQSQHDSRIRYQEIPPDQLFHQHVDLFTELLESISLKFQTQNYSSNATPTYELPLSAPSAQTYDPAIIASSKTKAIWKLPGILLGASSSHRLSQPEWRYVNLRTVNNLFKVTHLKNTNSSDSKPLIFQCHRWLKKSESNSSLRSNPATPRIPYATVQHDWNRLL